MAERNPLLASKGREGSERVDRTSTATNIQRNKNEFVASETKNAEADDTSHPRNGTNNNNTSSNHRKRNKTRHLDIGGRALSKPSPNNAIAIGVDGGGNGGGDANNNNNNMQNMEYSGTIPMAPMFVFCMLFCGLVLIVCVMAASVYLTLQANADTLTDQNDVINIVLPVLVYVVDIVECVLYYLEARNFQLYGYASLFQQASTRSKINFRVLSIYVIAALATYAVFISHEQALHISEHERNLIFLIVWSVAYAFVVASLFAFAAQFYTHNRRRPRPDLFFPHAIANNRQYVQNSPALFVENVVKRDEQTEVITKLYKDKSTLLRQLEAMRSRYNNAQRELQQLQHDNTLSLHEHDDESELVALKRHVQKLRGSLRSEREHTKTMTTQLDSKQTMLDAQNGDCVRLKAVLQTRDERIAQLQNEKESLERNMNGMHDEKNDLLLLQQVKEEEIEIAKQENTRLRKKIQQLTEKLSMQNENDDWQPKKNNLIL